MVTNPYSSIRKTITTSEKGVTVWTGKITGGTKTPFGVGYVKEGAPKKMIRGEERYLQQFKDVLPPKQNLVRNKNGQIQVYKTGSGKVVSVGGVVVANDPNLPTPKDVLLSSGEITPQPEIQQKTGDITVYKPTTSQQPTDIKKIATYAAIGIIGLITLRSVL